MQWWLLLAPLLFWGPFFWFVPRVYTAFFAIPAAVAFMLFFFLI